MEIKRYDIVEYRSEPCRVMQVDYADETVYISGYHHWIGASDVKLLKSVTVPTFEIGDKVVIKPISAEDKYSYVAGWDDDMNGMMASQSGPYVIKDYFDVDDTYEINGFWFAAYHLELAPTYDIV